MTMTLESRVKNLEEQFVIELAKIQTRLDRNLVHPSTTIHLHIERPRYSNYGVTVLANPHELRKLGISEDQLDRLSNSISDLIDEIGNENRPSAF